VQRENARLKEQIKELMESLSSISAKEFDDMSVKDLRAMHESFRDIVHKHASSSL
jgi:hypothetical protein